MPITTGQFFRCVLSGSVPTALGAALDTLQSTIAPPWTAAKWGQALALDIAKGAVIEDATVVDQFQRLLLTYPDIFNALLTTVYLKDAQGNYTAVPVAKVFKDQTFGLGKQANLLNVPWPSPPHPGGQFVWRLIDTLTPYDEQ